MPHALIERLLAQREVCGGAGRVEPTDLRRHTRTSGNNAGHQARSNT